MEFRCHACCVHWIEPGDARWATCECGLRVGTDFKLLREQLSVLRAAKAAKAAEARSREAAKPKQQPRRRVERCEWWQLWRWLPGAYARR